MSHPTKDAKKNKNFLEGWTKVIKSAHKDWEKAERAELDTHPQKETLQKIAVGLYDLEVEMLADGEKQAPSFEKLPEGRQYHFLKQAKIEFEIYQRVKEILEEE